MRKPVVIGVVLLVVGVPLGLGLLLLTVASVSRGVDGLQRVAVSTAPAPITFDQPGDVTVFAEVDHAVGKGSARPPVTVSIRNPAGVVATSHPYDTNTTYNLGGHSGIAVATLAVPSPGTYDVAVDGIRPGDGVLDLALGGTPIGVGFVLGLVGGILILVGSLVAGILLVVLGRLRGRPAAS